MLSLMNHSRNFMFKLMYYQIDQPFFDMCAHFYYIIINVSQISIELILECLTHFAHS